MNIKNAFYAMAAFGFMGNAILVADDYNQNSTSVREQNEQTMVRIQKMTDSMMVADAVIGGAFGCAVGAFVGPLALNNKSSKEQPLHVLCGAIAVGLVGAGLGYLYGTHKKKCILEEAEKSLDKKDPLRKELNKQN